MLSNIGQSFNRLCIGLRCSPADLQRMAMDETSFRWSKIVKRRRGSSKPREVWGIEDPLRRAQRQIARWLKSAVNEQDKCVTAFRDDASILENASRHVAGDFVLTVDLEDFYGSITLAQVRQVFESHKVHPQIALTLARICCVRGALMQGGRASPYIANLAGEPVDRIVTRLAPNCVYTRYVDDLTLSGANSDFPTEQELTSTLASTGFRLRRKSYRVAERRNGAFVTGLNIAKGVPRISRAQRRQMERFLDYATHIGYIAAAKATFKHGRRTGAKAQDDIIRYARGVAFWARSINKNLGDYWLLRIKGLHP